MKNKWKPVVLGIVGAAVLVAAITLIYSRLICRNTWYGHTSINGIDVSGYTMEDSKELFPDGKDYTLTVDARDGGELVIRNLDISYKTKVNDIALLNAFEEQHEHLTLPWFSHEPEAVYDVSYDEGTLKNIINTSDLVIGSSAYPITEPEAAKIVYSGESGTVEIQGEVYGNHIDKDRLYEAVCEALDRQQASIDVSDGDKYPDMYLQPELLETDPQIQEQLSAFRYYTTRFLTWDLQMGDTETMTPEDIFSVSEYADGAVAYNRDKLRDWIEQLCLKYKTANKDRTFTNHNGKQITVPAGDYGWFLEYEDTVQQAVDALGTPVDKDAVDAYLADPTDANAEKLTTTLEAKYKTTAFRKDYTGYQDWDPDNYIEVSLSEQMVYVHQNGSILPNHYRQAGRGAGDEKRRVLYQGASGGAGSRGRGL